MRTDRAATGAPPERTAVAEPMIPLNPVPPHEVSRQPAPPPPTPRHRRRARARAWAELLRLPALFTVPGDALAGAAAASARPTPRTLLAIASSLCLYEAGMALNDWADRDVDAVERPHRPLPSGRIQPSAALGAACALTGAGLTLAACAGRPALTVAVPLAATVWAYDLGLKNTPAGPLAMATARGLDLLLGAAATAGEGTESRGGGAGALRRNTVGAVVERTAGAVGLRRKAGQGIVGRTSGRRGGAGVRASAAVVRPSAAVADAVRAVPGAAAAADLLPGSRRNRPSAVLPGVRETSPAATSPGIREALPSAALLGAHTLAVTSVSRGEAQGGSPLAPFAALAVTAALTRTVARQRSLPSTRTDDSRHAHGARGLAPLAERAAPAPSRLTRPWRPPGPRSQPFDPHAALRLA
ncbi:UbiA family prenyltransferase, partial [Streptomyces sp. NRRL B-24085]|uniref:UbiA family prenyltransferase n=1 Tax=Streptomyces sp. NRRL B-24085 TaxID=1709476 RepID=UPI000AE0CF82